MKRDSLIATGVALMFAFAANTLRAQNDTPAPTTLPATVPATNQPPASTFQNNLTRLPLNAPNQQPGVLPGGGTQQPFPRTPPRFRQPHLVFNRALGDLRMVKLELQRAQGDLGGHKDSAIEACNKAIEELTAAMKSLPTPPPPGQPPSGGGITPAPTPLQGAPPPATPGAPANPPQN